MQVFNTPNVQTCIVTVLHMSESQTWNHHMTSYENDDSNNRVLSFSFETCKPVRLSNFDFDFDTVPNTRGGHRESSRCYFRTASRNVKQLFLTVSD